MTFTVGAIGTEREPVVCQAGKVLFLVTRSPVPRAHGV